MATENGGLSPPPEEDIDDEYDEGENTWDQNKFCIEVDEVSTTRATNNTKATSVVAKLTPTRKLLKCFVALFVVLVVYIALLTSNSMDSTFVMIGGLIGSLSSAFVMYDIVRTSNYGLFNTLFWRAVCDLCVSVSFVLNPAYNYYLCGNSNCQRDQVDGHNCQYFSMWLQFFLISAEAWFLCNGLELINSISRPFTTFDARLKEYHFYAWLAGASFAFLPFITLQSEHIYGIWYVTNENDTATVCWLKIDSVNQLGYPVWFLFLVPLALVYIFCIFSVVYAYDRLQKGLARSFLPRIVMSYKLMLTNASNILVIALYWLIFFIVYGTVFFSRFQTYSEDLIHVLHFIFGSKGLAILITWFLNSDMSRAVRSDTKNETMDVSTVYRQEVLSFATAAIRSTARGAMKITPDVTELIRKPQEQVRSSTSATTPNQSKKINFVLFFRFLLYDSEEVLAIHNVMKTKYELNEGRRSERKTMHSRLSSRYTQDKNSMISRPSEAIVGNPLQSGNGGGNGSIITPTEGRPSTYSHTSEQLLDGAQEPVLNTCYERMYHSLFFSWLEQGIEFKECQPYHFRRIRLASGVSDKLYIDAFSATIKERITEGGASGAFFFFSKGEMFLAKSCIEEDMMNLELHAKDYADYIENNKDTYISKILGAYRLRFYGVYLCFFVMNNLFYNQEGITMHEKYDLKGSWENRNAKPLLDGQCVACSYCEQNFIYRKKTLAGASASRSYSKTFSVASGNDDLDNMISDLKKTPVHMSKLYIGSSSASHDLSGDPMDEILEEGFSGHRDALAIAAAFKQQESIDKNKCPFSENREHEPSVILKDNDIKHTFRISPETASSFLRQLRKDVQFLASLGIMDYSLLLGVHNREYVVKLDIDTTTASLPTSSTSSTGSGASLALARKLKADLSSKAEAFKVVGPDCYFMGIIDFQQQWNWKKRLERFFKTRIKGADPDGLSAIEPKQYMRRFLRKIEDIFDTEK